MSRRHVLRCHTESQAQKYAEFISNRHPRDWQYHQNIDVIRKNWRKHGRHTCFWINPEQVFGFMDCWSVGDAHADGDYVHEFSHTQAWHDLRDRLIFFANDEEAPEDKNADVD